MSSQTNLLSDELLRARILKVEYAGFDEHTLRQLYMEETGENLDVNIDIYNSEDYVDEVETKGFNGTIIHLYDEEKGINEVYTIARGTEFDKEGSWRELDAVYDLMGVYAGLNADQYKGLSKFEKEVLQEIENQNMNTELTKIGLGHSLGGVLIIMLQLLSGDYDEVHTLNSAQPSVYKMALVDSRFYQLVRMVYNLDPNDPYDIYNIEPEKLEKLAKEYYQEAGEVIIQTSLTQDILQAIFPLPGFFEVGEYVTPVDGFPGENVESLIKVFENFPESVARDLQKYLAENYASVYNADGVDGLLRELAGVDAELVDTFIEAFFDKESDYTWREKIGILKESYVMLKDVSAKVPELLEMLQSIQKELPDILDALVETGYISELEKAEIMDHFDLLVEDITVLLEMANYLIDNLFLEITGAILYLPAGIERFSQYYQIIAERINNIPNRLEGIQDNLGAFLDVFAKAGEAHTTAKVIDTLSLKENKFFNDNGDLMIRQVSGRGAIAGASHIFVNLSSAIRVYTYGSSFVDQKEELLKELILSYESNYLDDYKSRTGTLLGKIEDMEKYPYRYQHLVGKFTPDAQRFYRVKRIVGHEDIAPLPQSGFKTAFENIFAYINKEINEEREMLKDFETAIKKLVQEDANIAQEMR